jgi:hypothetical protein
MILIGIEKKILTEQLSWVRCNEKELYQGEHMLFNARGCTSISEKDVMVLQNSTNSENILMGPYGEMYPASHDAKQAVNVKSDGSVRYGSGRGSCPNNISRNKGRT